MKIAKILEICSFPPPRTGWGVRVEFIKYRLEEIGHNCVVLNLGQNRKIKSQKYESVKNGFDYCLKLFIYSVRGFIFHTHVNGKSIKGLFLTLIAEIINILTFKRCVLTFHAGVFQDYFPIERSGKWYIFYRILFLLPQNIICNNEAVKEKIVEYGIQSEKIVPIPAFTRQYLQYETVTFSQDLENIFSTHSPILLCYIKFRKGFYFETLINSMKYLKSDFPKFCLILVGPEKEDIKLEERIRSLIKEFNFGSNIYEISDLSHDEFRSAMKRSTIFLRTPPGDGVSSSVMEALSYGIPVVAAENQNRPCSVITYIPDDPKDMAAKVKLTIENLDRVHQNIVKPVIQDTLEKEVNLLIAAAI